MVIVMGTMRMPPQNVERARPLVQALADATRAEDGCIAYGFAEDLLEPGLIRLAEQWRDAEALAAHVGRPHVLAWRAAAAELGVYDRDVWAYDGAGDKRGVGVK